MWVWLAGVDPEDEGRAGMKRLEGRFIFVEQGGLYIKFLEKKTLILSHAILFKMFLFLTWARMEDLLKAS
jgi:hypothetical protein